jgi:hypothetical protein
VVEIRDGCSNLSGRECVAPDRVDYLPHENDLLDRISLVEFGATQPPHSIQSNTLCHIPAKNHPRMTPLQKGYRTAKHAKTAKKMQNHKSLFKIICAMIQHF